MPTYDLRNIETGEVKEMFLSISKKEELVAQGEWVQVQLGTPKIVTQSGGVLSKTSGDWRDLLKGIQKSSGGNSGLSAEKKRQHGFVDNTIKTY